MERVEREERRKNNKGGGEANWGGNGERGEVGREETSWRREVEGGEGKNMTSGQVLIVETVEGRLGRWGRDRTGGGGGKRRCGRGGAGGGIGGGWRVRDEVDGSREYYIPT